MKQQTKKPVNWLVLAAWIMGGLCLAAAIVLTVLIVNRPGGEEAQQPEPTPAATSAAEAAEEPVEEEEEKPTRPILDLPANPYTREDFGYRGAYLECTAGPCSIGIDVSSWQKEIDWQQVKDAGMEFAVIRFAWRGNTEGGLYVDKRAVENYQGAKEAGLKIGGYVFSQAVSVEEAVEEAEFVLELIKDWEVDMPIVFDWERSANRTVDVDRRTLTDCTQAFCRTIEEAGYEAMVYFNIRQIYNEVYIEELKDYDLWLAMYDADMVFPYKVNMWQHTSKGSVPGIGTNVDLNILFEYE